MKTDMYFEGFANFVCSDFLFAAIWIQPFILE